MNATFFFVAIVCGVLLTVAAMSRDKLPPKEAAAARQALTCHECIECTDGEPALRGKRGRTPYASPATSPHRSPGEGDVAWKRKE
jgi:hypothetical protein